MAKSTVKKKVSKPKNVEKESISPEKSRVKSRRLVRSRRDRMVGGVAGGIAEYFEIDPIIIRLLFVLITFTVGSGLLIYIILWIIIPEEGDEGMGNKEVIRKNSKEFEKTVGEIVESKKNRKMLQLLFGISVVLLGFYMISSNLGYTSFATLGWFLSKFWPVAIIALGLFILVGNKNEK